MATVQPSRALNPALHETTTEGSLEGETIIYSLVCSVLKIHCASTDDLIQLSDVHVNLKPVVSSRNLCTVPTDGVSIVEF